MLAGSVSTIMIRLFTNEENQNARETSGTPHMNLVSTKLFGYTPRSFRRRQIFAELSGLSLKVERRASTFAVQKSLSTFSVPKNRHRSSQDHGVDMACLHTTGVREDDRVFRGLWTRVISLKGRPMSMRWVCAASRASARTNACQQPGRHHGIRESAHALPQAL